MGAKFLLITTSLLAGFSPAFGAEENQIGKVGSGNNIFSCPDKEEAPSFVDPSAGHGLVIKENNIPNFMQVKDIPSLTPAQRKQIHAIYHESKQEISSAMQELQSLRKGLTEKKSPTKAGSEDEVVLRRESRVAFFGNEQAYGQNMARIKIIRQQIKASRQKTWDRVRPLLTERNLKDLELMKKGQLMPANKE